MTVRTVHTGRAALGRVVMAHVTGTSRGRAVMDSVEGASPRQLARIAGALYLINVVAGAFAIGFVQQTVFVSDPAITAQNIQTHELLYRSGLAAHVVVT